MGAVRTAGKSMDEDERRGTTGEKAGWAAVAFIRKFTSQTRQITTVTNSNKAPTLSICQKHASAPD